MKQLFEEIANEFYKSVIKDDRYMYIVEGLKNTLIMSFFSIILCLFISLFIALVNEISNKYPNKKGLKFLKKVCNLYVNLIRGTPGVVQLMIIYYIIFNGVEINILIVGIISFGVGSGAYVSEIIRAGIESVDKGQTEAAKSLGLNYFQRMKYIILPQAIRNILPALVNEFITLIKETSIAGYIGINDLTRASSIISSRTYNYFFPLIIIAIIYICVVLLLTKLANILEKRLAIKNA